MKESIKQFRITRDTELQEVKKQNVTLEQYTYFDRAKKYIPTQVARTYIFLQQIFENRTNLTVIPILEYVIPSKRKIAKIIAFLVISLTCWNGYAQQNILLSGGWNVNEQHPFTCITDGSLPTAKRFRLTNTTLVDGEPVKFRIHDDGGTYTAILPEGGGMIIDSKSLAISQLNAGSSFQGNWDVLDDNQGFDQVSWSAYPTQNERVLLGAFDTETMFTLTINKSLSCSGGLMLIYVDDQVVTDLNNQPLEFLEGSSIAGFGKKIEVKVTGSCTGGNSFVGTLKIEE